MYNKLKITIAFIALLMSCNGTNEPSIKTIENPDIDKTVQIITTNKNEVLLIVHQGKQQDVFNELYVFQTDNDYSIELDEKYFLAEIYEGEDELLVLDIETNQSYVFTFNDELVNDDLTFLGYGLSKHEGEFPTDVFLINKQTSVFNKLTQLNLELLGEETKPNNQILTPGAPCAYSSCSIGWMIGLVYYTCSVSCRDGFNALCVAYSGCSCEKCEEEKPGNNAPGSTE